MVERTGLEIGVDLCHQRLSWQPKNDGSTFKVVYIVGTGNNDKLINMEPIVLRLPTQTLMTEINASVLRGFWRNELGFAA
jgi:hypothetical protein